MLDLCACAGRGLHSVRRGADGDAGGRSAGPGRRRPYRWRASQGPGGAEEEEAEEVIVTSSQNPQRHRRKPALLGVFEVSRFRGFAGAMMGTMKPEWFAGRLQELREAAWLTQKQGSRPGS